MFLAIDIGNSNVVIGLMQGKQVLYKARVATDIKKTSDQYWMDLKNTLELFGFTAQDVEGTVLSSVVPQVLNSCRTAVKKLTGREPLVIGPGVKTGLNIRADNPAQVGSDLIAAAIAAVKEYPLPLLIVDMGTATTISAIDKSGAFLGCSISPGVKISAEALSGRTAQLPGISLEAPKQAIGRNTVDSMRSGTMLGTAAMIDGMLARMEQELGESATVVATGGIAKYVIPLCTREILYDNDLLLKGLATLYENNQ